MNIIETIRFRLLPVLAGVVVVIGAYALHENLKHSEIHQISLIAESESYAARSRLVRNFDLMLEALNDVKIYWATYGHLPQDQWASDAGIEMNHFQGIEFILWSQSSRAVRFVRSADHPVFNYQPSDAEWDRYTEMLERSRQLGGDSMLGPHLDANGKPYLEIYLVPDDPEEEGTLIARIRPKESFDALLKNDSPGFAIKVDWHGHPLYQRGDMNNGLPPNWTRSGLIRNSLGAVWKVTHVPTRELADSLRAPAIDLVRTAGLIIAILMSLLLYETGRAERRARAAEQAEREIAALNRDLEAQVQERTEELAERSQDLVTITESVGHDLRNPLNSISANTQLLLQQFGEPLGEDGQSMLKQISGCISGMTEILDRLLAVSVVSSSRFARQRIDMQALAREIFDDLLIADRKPPSTLVLGDLPDAMAEPIMVRTLLMNLFSNALKFSRQRDERHIRMDAERQGDEVVYRVADNGIGFDEEVGSRLFRAFERLDNGDTEGLGLGLDIATRVVLRHRGRIFAKSKPGQGAEFFFTLGEAGVAD